LCEAAGGQLVVDAGKFRVIRADEEGFPAFWRVVWTGHVAEFSDLCAADRAQCMEAVAQVERVVRAQLAPAKINLAALGNMVPHLHWHVIARFADDSRFPAPVWAPAARPLDTAQLEHLRTLLPQVDEALRAAFATPSAIRAAS
jgi:diadenosine tetraphosphate (Ap4A) HIT family hydrolase